MTYYQELIKQMHAIGVGDTVSTTIVARDSEPAVVIVHGSDVSVFIQNEDLTALVPMERKSTEVQFGTARPRG